MAQGLTLASRLPIDRQTVQKMSAVIALLSLITLVIAYFLLPNVTITLWNFIFLLALALAFFLVYLFLPFIYFHETFLMLGDLVYIATITYIATQAGSLGTLILFLYFVIIVADALKYPLAEYAVIVIFALQAAFFYVILFAPFPGQVKIGILALFSFSTISVAVFIWYFVYQVIYQQSMRFVLERKTDYLKTMNDHLKAVDQMRSSVLKVASHELQTPLAAVKNSLYLLQTSNFGKLNEKQLELLGLATNNNERLARLVQTLLDTTRIQGGDWKLELTHVSYNELINDIVKEYKPLYAAKKVKLTVEVPKEAIMIDADPHLLRIACKNLIDNALKYTPEGSVTISLKKDGKGPIFSVTDTGIGLSDEAKKHLFTQFNRSEEAIAISPDGYGIGLHFTRLIVRRHGGDVAVTSEKGKGSTFTINLPKKITVHHNKEEHNET